MSSGKLKYRKAQLYKELQRLEGEGTLRTDDIYLMDALEDDPEIQRLIEMQQEIEDLVGEPEEAPRGLTTDDGPGETF